MEKVELEVGMLESYIAKRVKALASDSIARKGKFTIALSGGRSPAIVLEKIAEELNAIKQGTIQILQVDERFVPNDSKDSNFKMIRENFISKLKSSLTVSCYIVDTSFTYTKSIERYKDSIDNLLERDSIDLCLLGVGEDGHIASLFEVPDRDNCDDPSVIGVGRDDFDRVTLTYRSLLESNEIFIYAPGESKNKIVENATSEFETCKYPVQVIAANHSRVSIFATLLDG